MDLEIVSEIHDKENIVVGRAIRELDRLVSAYGKGRWRKCKGFATIRFPDCTEMEV